MSLGAFVQQPQVNPFVGGAVPATQPKTLQVDTAALQRANQRPNGFIAGITKDSVAVFAYPDSREAEHGDVSVFKRPSGTVGVQQFIHGDWKTLYNEDEAKKKFGSVPVAPAPAPTPPPVQAPAPQTNQVMGVMILGATTDNALVGQSAENKTVGIVKRDSGTVGVKQMINGKWETLVTEAEATKKFGKTGGSMKRNQPVLCLGCEELVDFSDMTKAKDGYYYCCAECMEEAGTEPA